MKKTLLNALLFTLLIPIALFAQGGMMPGPGSPASAGGGGGSPTFDASSSTTSTGNGVITFSHTTSGSNRLLVVCVGTKTSISVSSATYNGVSMTALGSVVDNTDSFANSRLKAFYLIAPATGANNIAVTFSGAPEDRSVIGMSYTGVNQVTPFGTVATNTTNNTTAPTVTVTGASGDLIIDCHSSHNTLSSTSAGSGQTSRVSVLTTIGLMSSTEAGASSVVMDWSNGTSRWYSSLGVALKP